MSLSDAFAALYWRISEAEPDFAAETANGDGYDLFSRGRIMHMIDEFASAADDEDPE